MRYLQQYTLRHSLPWIVGAGVLLVTFAVWHVLWAREQVQIEQATSVMAASVNVEMAARLCLGTQGAVEKFHHALQVQCVTHALERMRLPFVLEPFHKLASRFESVAQIFRP